MLGMRRAIAVFPEAVSDDSNPMNYAPSDKKFIITEINEDLRETTLPVTNHIA